MKSDRSPTPGGEEDLSGPRQDFERSIYEMTDKEDRTQSRSVPTYGDAVTNAAEHVGIPREQIDRFLGTIQMCGWHLAPIVTSEKEDKTFEDMKVTLGACLALMAQSGNPACEEMARRIPFTIKNGEPYALVTR